MHVLRLGVPRKTLKGGAAFVPLIYDFLASWITLKCARQPGARPPILSICLHEFGVRSIRRRALKGGPPSHGSFPEALYRIWPRATRMYNAVADTIG